MKTNDFISDVLDILSENITYAPIWTRANVLSYLRETLNRFAQLTLIVDSDSLRLVSSTTGESTVPSNFLNTYYVMYDKTQLDIVPLGELDFVSATWSIGTTGVSPLASTVMGSGKDAVIRITPVPTNVLGPLGYDAVLSVILADSDGVLWTLSVSTIGIISATVVASGTAQTVVLSRAGTYWDVTINTSGVLSTTASSSTSPQSVFLKDSDGMQWGIIVDIYGVLSTDRGYGKLIRLEVDGSNQTITSNYGTVSDAYAEGSTTTPTVVARLNSPYGIVTMGRVSDGALHVWYKGLLDDTPNTESEIHLNNCFIPIIQHGVLALAYNMEGTGRDEKKAKALEMIFTVECDSVRRIFNKK